MAITLTVETGSASSIANCYASLAQATAYFTNRGSVTLWNTYTTEQQKAAIIKGAQFVDYNYPWVGFKTASKQAMQWPRQQEMPQYPYGTDQIATGIVDVGGWEISTTVVPTQVVHANLEMAMRFITTTTIIADQDRKTVREKVGDIEVEYDKASSVAKRYPVVDQLLRGLYESGSQIRLNRR